MTPEKETQPPAIFEQTPLPPLFSISPRLVENPQAILQPWKEVAWYWQQQPKQYRDAITRLNFSLAEPMNTRCKLAIGIPAYGEKANIYRALSTYPAQKDIAPEEFEVLVFENHPANTQRDNTLLEIQRFQTDYPDFTIRHIYAPLPENTPMGTIRKIVLDVALFRAFVRYKAYGPYGHSLILGSHDADSFGMKERSLRIAIDSFAEDPELDILVGRWDYPKEALRQFPTLHATLRFHRFFQVFSDRIFGRTRPVTSGASSYFNLATFAAIGGIDPTLSKGEDSNVGDRLAMIRAETSTQRIRTSNGVRVFTDPRRSLAKMQRGISWAQQWDVLPPEHDPVIIGSSWRDFSGNDPKPFDAKQLEEEINAFRFVQHIGEAVETKPELRTVILRKTALDHTMAALGTTYHFEHGRLVLDDTTVLEKRLAEYAQTD